MNWIAGLNSLGQLVISRTNWSWSLSVRMLRNQSELIRCPYWRRVISGLRIKNLSRAQSGNPCPASGMSPGSAQRFPSGPLPTLDKSGLPNFHDFFMFNISKIRELNLRLLIRKWNSAGDKFEEPGLTCQNFHLTCVSLLIWFDTFLYRRGLL